MRTRTATRTEVEIDQDFTRTFQRAGQLLEVGMAPTDITNVLTRENYPAETVAKVVQHLTSVAQPFTRPRIERHPRSSKLVHAVLWCAGGIFVSSFNYLISGPTWLFFLAWLVVIYGVVKLMKNLRHIIF
jgi:hypothetical protein